MSLKHRTFSMWVSFALPALFVAGLAWFAHARVCQERLNRHLIAAIHANNTAAALRLLRTGADANTRGYLGQESGTWARFLSLLPGRRSEQENDSPPVLLQAIAQKNIALATALIKRGAKINARMQFGNNSVNSINDLAWIFDHETPLIWTILDAPPRFARFGQIPPGYEQDRQRYEKLVRALLDNGADINATDGAGGTPLMSAAFVDEDRLVKLLLDRGANVNAKNREGTTALTIALITGNDRTIRLLLSRGAKANIHSRYGQSAFVGAAMSGLNELVSELLAEGADVNSRNTEGDTALIEAVQEGNLPLARFLLDRRADPNMVGRADFGSLPPLIYAVRQAWSRAESDIEIVKLLLKKGANINARDSEGQTALIEAVSDYSDRVVPLLLNAGADTSVVDGHGDTALSIARKHKVHGDGDEAWLTLTRSGVKR